MPMTRGGSSKRLESWAIALSLSRGGVAKAETITSLADICAREYHALSAMDNALAAKPPGGLGEGASWRYVGALQHGGSLQHVRHQPARSRQVY